MFERQYTRTDVVSLKDWQAGNQKTTEQLKAIQEREQRDWANYERALKQYQRRQKVWPVRVALGLWDVMTAFVRGER